MCVIVFLTIIFSSCDYKKPYSDIAVLTDNVKTTDTLISKRQLRRNGFNKRELLVIYNSEDPKLKFKYKELLEQVSKTPQQGRFSITTKYKSIKETSDEDLTNNMILLVGTANDNALIKEFTTDLPFHFSENSITFNATTYNKKQDIVSLQFYPNPKNKTLPFSIITGNNAVEVFEFISNKMLQSDRRQRFFQTMDYEIFRDNSRIAMGNFNASWQIDPSVSFEYSTGNDTISKSKHFNFISHQNAISNSEILILKKDIEASTKAIRMFLGQNQNIPKINYHIYKTAEDKGLMLNRTEQAHFDIENNAVHTVINAKYQDNFIQKENDLIINHLLGNAKSLALSRGLPVYFTTKWQREGYKYWAGRLAKSNNALSLKELFDNDLVTNESGLVVDCMSATLVAFLIKTWGASKFIKHYNNWVPTSLEINELKPLWEAYLSQLAAQAKLPQRRSDLAYLKGFNFAHEGYGIYNGYTSRKATESLQKQKRMGSNAISIVPYSFIRGGEDATPSYLSLNNSARGENDQGVIHSAYEAKQLGMSVLLKPQVFVGGSWSGAMDFKTETQWQSFFNYYYRWIRHYAFLAEIHNIAMFSVGVEFSKATLTHEADWTKMIKNLRGLYSGKLTYCANWGEEFETINLWEDLDFIGINSYYPLSDSNDATDTELKANFKTVTSKIERIYNKHKKPIVFTEIGFRSLNAPWKLPYSDGDNTIFNEEHQDRAYNVVFEGIENKPWCAGILWWKFPSYLEYRGRENISFTPNNKKAEHTVKLWFTESN